MAKTWGGHPVSQGEGETREDREGFVSGIELLQH